MWRRCVPLKCEVPSELRNIAAQKTGIFMVTTVKTSDPSFLWISGVQTGVFIPSGYAKTSYRICKI
jgi:hypothetical protein